MCLCIIYKHLQSLADIINKINKNKTNQKEIFHNDLNEF